MNLRYSNETTKTAGSYSFIAADGFFNALSFNDRARTSANLAEPSVQVQNRPQSLRKASYKYEGARKACARVRTSTKSPAKFAQAFVQAQSHQQSLRADLRKERSLFQFDFIM